jgi:transposase-like protein
MPIHHIIPRHAWKVRFGDLIGFDAPDNKVFLTIEQHAHVHLLLFELEHNKYDWIAYRAMSAQIGKDEIVRQVASATHLGKKKNYPVWNKGKILGPKSEELKQKLRGRIPWNKGLVGVMPEYRHSEDTLAVMKVKRNARTRAPRPKGFKMSQAQEHHDHGTPITEIARKHGYPPRILRSMFRQHGYSILPYVRRPRTTIKIEEIGCINTNTPPHNIESQKVKV